MSYPKRIPGGHDWFSDFTHDDIDSFRFNNEHHNGPECRRCGRTGCHHCEPTIYDEPCRSSQTEMDVP